MNNWKTDLEVLLNLTNNFLNIFWVLNTSLQAPTMSYHLITVNKTSYYFVRNLNILFFLSIYNNVMHINIKLTSKQSLNCLKIVSNYFD